MDASSRTKLWLACVICIWLYATGSTAEGHWRSARNLGQVGASEAAGDPVSPKAALARWSRPFLAIADPESASSSDAQRLYDQASSISAVAYLLFGAAEPLAKVEGSSRALLPYLTPTVLRIYASQSGQCSSSLVEQLYGLAQRLYGSSALQACQYDLYKALRSTFGWVAAGNIPLAFHSVPGQPASATAACPDLSALSDADFAAAVSQALKTRPELSEAAAVLSSGRCGLDVAAFTALVPSISSALSQLHVDLAELQGIASDRIYASAPKTTTDDAIGASATGTGRRRSQLALGAADAGQAALRLSGANELREAADGLARDGSSDLQSTRRRRRGLATLPSSSYQYDMPPADFQVQPPAAMPGLRIGLVFHIMQYRDRSNGTGPAKYDMSPSYVRRLVRVVNHMSKPTNIEFFVKDVRFDSRSHPYLLLKDRRTWLQVADIGCMELKNGVCFMNSDFMPETVVDFPRSINVYVANDLTARKGLLGYSFTPGSDTLPSQGFVHLSWDQLSADGGSNSLALYNDGPHTLLHELFHHLGLEHPFDRPMGASQCYDGDEVLDTPSAKGPIRMSSFFSKATEYCLEVFWGIYGGDWEATYDRWSSTLGIPDLDKNAWADSCARDPGYDELGNYMTYNTPVCFAALGHFTAGQAQRAHYVTSEMNPVLYAWAQYYAAQEGPAPPHAPQTPEYVVNDTCRATAKDACWCKETWRYGGRSYSYCDRTERGNNTLSCEVADPASCPSCTSLPAGQQCVLPCAGTPRMCKRPPAPGIAMPPPPPPRPPSPPPMPPPPPPDTAPQECMVSVRNCTCRSHWTFNGKHGTYCSPYAGSLRCLVTPSCPSFREEPLQACDPALNEAFCLGSRVLRPPVPMRKPAAPTRPPRPPRTVPAPPPRHPRPPRSPRPPKPPRVL